MDKKTVEALGVILANAFIDSLDLLTTEELLERYARITDAVDALVDEAGTIASILKARHAENGDVEMYGVRVYGAVSSSKNHEGAVDAWIKANPDDDELLDGVSDVIESFTTTKETTAWAKVTKELGIDLKPFTTTTPVVKVKYPA